MAVQGRLRALIQILITPGFLSAYPYVYFRCGIHVFYIFILSLMCGTGKVAVPIPVYSSACYDEPNLQLNSTPEIEIFGSAAAFTLITLLPTLLTFPAARISSFYTTLSISYSWIEIKPNIPELHGLFKHILNFQTCLRESALPTRHA